MAITDADKENIESEEEGMEPGEVAGPVTEPQAGGVPGTPAPAGVGM